MNDSIDSFDISQKAEQALDRGVHISQMNASIKKNLDKLNKNKSFLSLVDKMHTVVLSLANKIADSLPQESPIQEKVKVSLQDKIKKLRFEALPVTKRPHYSA